MASSNNSLSVSSNFFFISKVRERMMDPCEIWRKFITNQNETPQEELLTENHAIMMYSPLLESTTKA